MKNIKFVATSELLFYEKELMPQETKKFIPNWFKNINKSYKQNYLFNKFKIQNNINSCPSFIDVFNEGYVLLAPVDYLIKVNEDNSWNWQVPLKFDKHKGNNIPEVDVHDDNQMIKYLPKESNIKKVFKLNLPLEIITPRGYSSRQIAYPYTFNSNWEAAYGVLKTDKVHEASIQIYIKSYEEILIKQGTPLCVYIPFKREKFYKKYYNYATNKKIRKKLNINLLKVHGNYQSNYFKLHHKD